MGGGSIFDNFAEDDVVFAFFPCTMFQENNALIFRGNSYQMRNYTDEQKLEVCISRHKDLHYFYTILCELAVVVLRKGLRMILENPYTKPHYLEYYFPLEPKLIDQDRTERGDYFKKPTQYWFLNCEPQNHIMFEMVNVKDRKVINKLKSSGHERQRERSEISPDYANRFIREFIL